MNSHQFARNISNHSIEELATYRDQHVAWSEDGREVLAHAATLEELFREIDARGLTRYVLGYVPDPEESSLGGAEL